MKLTTSILVLMMAGGAWAQNPVIIQNTRDQMNTVQQKKTADSNAALGATQPQQSKPAPSVPASAGTTAKPAPSKPAGSKPAAAQAAAGKPAAAQTAASKPAAPNAAASKPAGPTVIPGQKIIAAPAPATAASKGAPAAKTATTAKPADNKVAAKPVAVIVPKTPEKGKKGQAKSAVQAQNAAPAKPEEKKYAMTGKRDPFLSPVVSHMGGSGCSTGKKCLEIGQVNLKGVVKADTGMIAVVTNSMNKAYFLRENDPVFNGYVEKITGDSITFKETFQDKLGKSFTRDVVKKILTPAV